MKCGSGCQGFSARAALVPLVVAPVVTATAVGVPYARLVPRLGKQKTIVAVQHSILIAVWHMLTNNVDYHDLGGDYFTKQDPERVKRHIIRQANALGLTARFDPIPDVA
jgi:transposase